MADVDNYEINNIYYRDAFDFDTVEAFMLKVERNLMEFSWCVFFLPQSPLIAFPGNVPGVMCTDGPHKLVSFGEIPELSRHPLDHLSISGSVVATRNTPLPLCLTTLDDEA